MQLKLTIADNLAKYSFNCIILLCELCIQRLYTGGRGGLT